MNDSRGRYFFTCSNIGNDDSYARGRSNRASILKSVNLVPRLDMTDANSHTLSPKPHIRARMGCCSTIRLEDGQQMWFHFGTRDLKHTNTCSCPLRIRTALDLRRVSVRLRESWVGPTWLICWSERKTCSRQMCWSIRSGDTVAEVLNVKFALKEGKECDQMLNEIDSRLENEFTCPSQSEKESF